MMNFACFIPGTADADFMRQQVGERGILEKIDAVNETIKQCLGECHSVSGISGFYKMIHEIECNLNQNMNDPRAKKLVNTFTEEYKAEVKNEAPKHETPVVPDTNDPADQVERAEVVDPTDNTEVIDPVGNAGDPADLVESADTADSTDQVEITNTADPTDNTETIDPVGDTGDPTNPVEGDTNESEIKRPTRKGRKKSEDTE